MKKERVAGSASRGPGRAEHRSERTPVRERGSAEDNNGIGRLKERVAGPASRGPGRAEHRSERTAVRERGSAEDNNGIGRQTGDEERYE
jgi:hypothetical protein